MPTNSLFIEETTLCLHQVTLNLFLGVTAEEQSKAQEILIDVTIQLPPPKALESDQWADTVCYAECLNVIQSLKEQRIALLEHVAYRIIMALQNHLPSFQKMSVQCYKKPPEGIKNIEQASFLLTVKPDR